MNKNPNPKNYSISKKSKSNQLFSLKKFSNNIFKNPQITHNSPLPPILAISRGSRTRKGWRRLPIERSKERKEKRKAHAARLIFSQKRNEGGELAAKRLLAGRIKISVRTLLLLLLFRLCLPPPPSCCEIKTGGRWPVTITRRYIYIFVHACSRLFYQPLLPPSSTRSYASQRLAHGDFRSRPGFIALSRKGGDRSVQDNGWGRGEERRCAMIICTKL